MEKTKYWKIKIQHFLENPSTGKELPFRLKDHARKDVKFIFFSILPKNLTSLEIPSVDFSVLTTFRLSRFTTFPQIQLNSPLPFFPKNYWNDMLWKNVRTNPASLPHSLLLDFALAHANRAREIFVATSSRASHNIWKEIIYGNFLPPSNSQLLSLIRPYK